MTIASEISRLQGAKADIKTAIEAKGVTVPSSAKLDSYDDYVAQIEQGGGYDGPYDILDYSAMQGPCDSGYHIPTNIEWTNIINIWIALGGGSNDSDNFSRYLRLPKAGYRNNSGTVTDQGTSAFYRTCINYSGNRNKCYRLIGDSSKLQVDNSYYNICGTPLRPFKDNSIIPTSTRTKLYGTSIEAGGIFWDNVDGLISLSSDGINRTTISDKNLGATSVWYYGNSLSQSNMGNMYQWGNCYGFPSTGSVTTASGSVNVSGYGPGNYYNDSTFRTGLSGGSWVSSNPRDLRGGYTGAKSSGQYVIIDGIKYKYSSILKSYEEILAMANSQGYNRSNTITELNKYPQDYFDMLNNGGYISQQKKANHIIGIYYYSQGKYNVIVYNNGTWSTSSFFAD